MTTSVPASEQWLCDFLHAGMASDRRRQVGLPGRCEDYGYEARPRMMAGKQRKGTDKNREVASA